METRHMGKIILDESILLEILNFEGGSIYFLGKEPGGYGRTCIVIEHPDMPAVSEGGEFPIVTPTYKMRDTSRIFPHVGVVTRLRRWLLRHRTVVEYRIKTEIKK